MLRILLGVLVVFIVITLTVVFIREMTYAIRDNQRRYELQFERRRRAWHLLRVATLEHELLDGPFDHHTRICVRCNREKYGEGVPWELSDRHRVDRIVADMERGYIK